MPGSDRSSTKSPTPVRRTLPSRSSRPLRATMRDGSDEDDVIQEMTRSPTGFRRSPVKPIPKRRASSSESDESESQRRTIKRKPRTKSVPRKCDQPDDDEDSFSTISASEMPPVKRCRGRPPKIIKQEEEEEEMKSEDDKEDGDDDSEQSSSSSRSPIPKRRKRQRTETPEEEDEEEENSNEEEEEEEEQSSSHAAQTPVKSKGGRPRKTPKVEPENEDDDNKDRKPITPSRRKPQINRAHAQQRRQVTPDGNPDSEEEDDMEPTTSSRKKPQIKRASGSQRRQVTPEEESDGSSDGEADKPKTPKAKLFKSPEKTTPSRRPRGRPRKVKPLKAATLHVSEVDSSEDSSALSDEDGRFNLEIVEAAKALVKRVYLPIMKTNASEMNSVFKGAFRESILAMPMKKYRMYRFKEDAEAEPMKIKEIKRVPDREVATVRSDDRESPEQAVKCHFICTGALRPRMKNWVHIEHNIKTEDNLRLSHIPYVDDDHDSAAFCRELTKAYPEGIHGIRHGWGKHISDYLLYLLLKQAIPQWEETKNEMRYLWRAIYKLFPNKLSARQLVFAFHTLDQRFNPRPGGEKEEASKKDDMQHSISTMLCIKCQQYHCLLHGVTSEEFRMHRKPMAKIHSRVQHPCGAECYMLIPEAEDRVRREKAKTYPPLPSTPQMIFQKMIHNNRNPPCQVAIMMAALLGGDYDGSNPLDIRSCADYYYMALALPPPERERSPDDIMKRKISIKEQQSSFRSHSWSNGNGRVDNSEQPKACRHQGPCGQTVADCYCGQQNTLCSKYCSCGPDCRLRFPGCRCQPGQCRTKSCQCFYAKWECDPDVCKSCNCGPYLFMPPEKIEDDQFEEEDKPTPEELEAILKRNEPVAVCSNINLQRGNYKGLKVGVSNVAGYGCFLDDTAEKGEFIAEYTGEVISKWEAERRGRVYDEYKCSYIFALNREQSVDATHFGNHIRFANHSDKHPNCHSQIIIVNGEHRIGIFAKRRIEKGEELLFDYQYDKKWKEQYVPVEITKGGAIKPHKSRHYSPSLHFRKSKKHANG